VLFLESQFVGRPESRPKVIGCCESNYKLDELKMGILGFVWQKLSFEISIYLICSVFRCKAININSFESSSTLSIDQFSISTNRLSPNRIESAVFEIDLKPVPSQSLWVLITTRNPGVRMPEESGVNTMGSLRRTESEWNINP